jgi:hypothetical protein
MEKVHGENQSAEVVMGKFVGRTIASVIVSGEKLTLFFTDESQFSFTPSQSDIALTAEEKAEYMQEKASAGN